MSIRIGIGYDLHKLVKERPLFLGGVNIPFSKGLMGHSDADVLLHAICDALLGSCALGDIGVHFPDTSDEFKGISGIELLKRTAEIISLKMTYSIVNIDTVIICDEPNLSKYYSEMRKTIADGLGIDKDKISIKAKTTEGTAPGVISSYAVVMVDIK